MGEDNNLKKQLIKEHKFLNSIESKKFTENFMVELGKELDATFPGVTYVMSLRYKSDKSIKGKIDKIATRTDPATKNIYDNIGIKIVVTHVSEKVKHANCQDIIQKREKFNNERQEKEAHRDNMVMELRELLNDRAENLLLQIKKIDEKYYSNYKFMFELARNTEGNKGILELERTIEQLEHYVSENESKLKESDEQKQIKKLNEILFKEKIKNKLDLIKEIKENVQNKRDLYNEQDRKCNDLYAEYILEQIKNNSKVLKNFGILSIPGRYKRHTGSTHYYVASHNSFKASKRSNIQNWKFEMQVTSDYYNQDATSGKAKHSEKEGKARVLPNVPANRKEFEETIKPIVPETYVYTSGSGKVKKCSNYESFFLYYKEVVEGPQYLKNLEKALEKIEKDDYEK